MRSAARNSHEHFISMVCVAAVVDLNVDTDIVCHLHLAFNLLFVYCTLRRSFQGATSGNGIPIVKVFKSALELALRALWTTKCTRLLDFSHIISTFSGSNTPDSRSGRGQPLPATTPAVHGAQALPVLGPRHQFQLGSPALPLFMFYETSLQVHFHMAVSTPASHSNHQSVLP